MKSISSGDGGESECERMKEMVKEEEKEEEKDSFR